MEDNIGILRLFGDCFDIIEISIDDANLRISFLDESNFGGVANESGYLVFGARRRDDARECFSANVACDSGAITMIRNVVVNLSGKIRLT